MKQRALISFGGAWLFTLLGGECPLFPDLPSIVAFFWFLYRPADLPFRYVLIFSLLDGMVGRIPLLLGEAVLFFILYAGALVMRLYIHARSFSVVWIFFAFLTLLLACLDGSFYLSWGGASFSLFLIKALSTIFCFPWIWRVLLRFAGVL